MALVALVAHSSTGSGSWRLDEYLLGGILAVELFGRLLPSFLPGLVVVGSVG